MACQYRKRARCPLFLPNNRQQCDQQMTNGKRRPSVNGPITATKAAVRTQGNSSAAREGGHFNNKHPIQQNNKNPTIVSPGFAITFSG